MQLQELKLACKSLTVLLIQCPSESLKLFIQDRLRESLHSTKESIFSVTNKKELKEASTLSVIQPFGVDKWIFLTDLDKIPFEDFIKTAEKCETGIFVCTTSKYFTYKNIKKRLKKYETFADLYLSYLRRNDFLYLYNWFVPEESKLTKALYDYVVKNYSSDIDAVFTLLRAMKDGEKVESKRDISNLCGLGGNTVESLVIGLLKSEPKTEKGLKTIVRNKLQSGIDLSQDLAWGKIWAYSLNFARRLVQVKELYIAGEIYSSITNLPEGYDTRGLVRLNRYLWFIKATPMSKLLQLVVLLEHDRWTCDLEFIRFVYEYYKIDINKRLVNASANN